MDIMWYVGLGVIGLVGTFWVIIGTMMAIDHFKDVRLCQEHLLAHRGARPACGECDRCWGVLHEGQG